MWLSHWNLARDPFADRESPYVSLPSHDEAVARLVLAVESAEPRVILAAPGGLGKTAVARRALGQSLQLRRRFVSVSCPRDETSLFARLAESLGQRVGREPRRFEPWRALERAIRLASLQGEQVVITIDDCDDHIDAPARRELDALARLGSAASAGLTMIQLQRIEDGDGLPASATWSARIGLKRLTRSQADDYLTTKLQWAGTTDRIFTPRAITRTHALSRGNPRELEQLARGCLITGATRGLEVITPELVDDFVHESGIHPFAASA
jgi:type II secretory pathway predicted ATPase ExeA